MSEESRPGGGLLDGLEIIHAYTRKQAIEDGEQVEVTALAKEAGLKFRVFVTRTVWNEYVEVPEEFKGEQDETGRLWDILWMLRCAITGALPLVMKRDDELQFQLHVRNDRETRDGELVTLKSVVGPVDIDDAAPGHDHVAGGGLRCRTARATNRARMEQTGGAHAPATSSMGLVSFAVEQCGRATVSNLTGAGSHTCTASIKQPAKTKTKGKQ